jgi:hypothetical protein
VGRTGCETPDEILREFLRHGVRVRVRFGVGIHIHGDVPLKQAGKNRALKRNCYPPKFQPGRGNDQTPAPTFVRLEAEEAYE